LSLLPRRTPRGEEQEDEDELREGLVSSARTPSGMMEGYELAE